MKNIRSFRFSRKKVIMSQWTNRKRGYLLALLIGALALAASLPASAAEKDNKGIQGFSLKFSGGLGYALSGGGDLESARLREVGYFQDLGRLDFYSTSMNWKRMSFLSEFSIEAIFNVSPSVGLGIGVGYIPVRSKGNYGFSYLENGTASGETYTYHDTGAFVQEFKMDVIPITFNIHYKEDLGIFNFYGYGGVGYYIGKMSHDFSTNLDLNYEDPNFQWQQTSQDASHDDITPTRGPLGFRGALGFNGGLGLELKLGSKLGLGLELFGRLLSFAMEGTNTDTYSSRTRQWREDLGWYSDVPTSQSSSVTGTLWYYESLDSTLNKYYSDMQILDVEPAGSTIRNLRQASINLNAVGFKISLFLHFD
jgi:hypothetical protein